MLRSIEAGEKESGLAIRGGSMERWCSSQPLMDQKDSGIRIRGGSRGNRGKTQMWEVWSVSWESGRDLHCRTTWG